mmetsp:Transcript_39110/g.98573  ORF Transcript_39110/g.98573 Transcript_39110/m.98573 type:complete len:254 (+) Transcript_39110:3497-4258(+)
MRNCAFFPRCSCFSNCCSRDLDGTAAVTCSCGAALAALLSLADVPMTLDADAERGERNEPDLSLENILFSEPFFCLCSCFCVFFLAAAFFLSSARFCFSSRKRFSSASFSVRSSSSLRRFSSSLRRFSSSRFSSRRFFSSEFSRGDSRFSTVGKIVRALLRRSFLLSVPEPPSPVAAAEAMASLAFLASAFSCAFFAAASSFSALALASAASRALSSSITFRSASRFFCSISERAALLEPPSLSSSSSSSSSS